MKLRCREGELALIIREEPGCESNIGRTVVVHPPIRNSPGQGPTWLIEPATSAPWLALILGGDILNGPITLEDFIEHPDAWLLPIRSDDESDQLVREVETPRLAGVDEVTHA